MAKLAQIFFLLSQFANVTVCFAWNAQKSLRPHHATYAGNADEVDSIPLPNHPPKSDKIYALTLQELESLESQPLCHRIAARLLVNNCHLLQGQDETIELADSGRLTRDFIDSYAAGLAICDLERGSFVIPRDCTNFREPVLAKIKIAKSPYLHVSTVEIDKCLEGLAQSDSSWNTWISYRHKAVRFCELAKIDNERDSTIHLYKKLTKVMERFSEQVEIQVEEQLRRVDLTMQKTIEVTDSLLPRAESLRSQLHGLDRLLNEKLVEASRKSAAEVQSGLEDATELGRVVKLLLKSIRQDQEEFVMEHSNALQTARKDTFDGVEAMMATIVTTASSSEEAELRTIRVMARQNEIEENLGRLQQVSHEMLVAHSSHQDKLDSAQQLAPSIARNILLLGLGEIAGLTISATQSISVGASSPFLAAIPTIFTNTFNDTTHHHVQDLQTTQSSTFLK
ncbi:hypothetical protein NLG97_g6637 [Lecanicillium saksenae]|uniref:Uncharacterized protein n=1 Tax=Lecanicillium saksenae TaxID=468837 RepID=A0ACC1QP27_9HYPO|nr:hypothetical protein NLG97_g6637 [Lecanicillium saksenae]